MKQATKGWVVITPKHANTGRAFMVSDSFRRTRTESIKSFCKGSGMPWPYWRLKYNFKCVRAETIIKLKR